MTKIASFITTSEHQTIAAGEEFAKRFHERTSPVVVLIQGEFGVGKTYFTKGIARELGVTEVVRSPSYTYVSEYKLPDGGELVHVDLWRAEDQHQVEAINLSQYLEDRNVMVVEWPGSFEMDANFNANIYHVSIIEGENFARMITVFVEDESSSQ